MPVLSTVSTEALRQRIRQSGRLKGRQADELSLRGVRELIGERPADGFRRDLLIEHLHLLADRYGGLHAGHLAALATETNVPMAEVYEVATFYHHFELLEGDAADAGGDRVVTVRVCESLACEMAGSRELLQTLQSGPERGIRLRAAPCVGRCEQAPVAVVGQRPVPFADEAAIASALAGAATRHPEPASGARFEPAERALQSVAPASADVAPAFVGYDDYVTAGGYALVGDLHAGRRDAASVLGELEASGLRGLGGAGFGAGRKWRIVAGQPAPRLLAVNIDEGEPGTFKDRTFLERDPHRFLEGMLVAAAVVGIDACYIYLRDEYHGCRDLLAGEIAHLQEAAAFALPRIELRRGAGAYICGEESAMVESIEGRRGEPRLRPPYIAERGLFGRPTLEHNFETLYWVRDIVARGAGWFAGFGRHGRHGLRAFSVSGRVRDAGVKLAPAGITLNELIAEYCGGMAEGHALYGFLPGGASGGILPASLADVPLDFDTLQPHGAFIGSAAVIVLGDRDRARDAALNAMRFFASESCGKCTPCRVGTEKSARLMAEPTWDLATLGDLADVLVDASICGLGQAAPNPMLSVVRHFGHELDARTLTRGEGSSERES